MHRNKVLINEARFSKNFYTSDLIHRHYLEKNLKSDNLSVIAEELFKMGQIAAGVLNNLSMAADKNPPQLVKRDAWGEDTDDILFHPAYKEMIKLAVESKMFHLKWKDNGLSLTDEANTISFGISYLFAMSESGLYCPLCMTDAAATLISKHCDDSDKKRLLEAIASLDVDSFKTGAMFLTEKAGGSDVGANLVTATHQEGRRYFLNGEKWFCSNVNAEIIFALARTDSEKKGTKGLSIFLIEPFKKDGSRNALNIIRLKDKLGVKSMASAECILNDTEGKLIGEEFNGFKIMTDMINTSRLYNAVAALSASRRALIEAFQFASQRKTFGKILLSHALVRDKFSELGVLHLKNYYLTWRTIAALDKAEAGVDSEKEILRLLTPMVKMTTADKGVYITRESMELMGGIGYIEDQVVPKLMRDIMVLPIWEGAGNIMLLDMLRASQKTKGLQMLFDEIQRIIDAQKQYKEVLEKELTRLKQQLEKIQSLPLQQLEVFAKYFFIDVIDLYQVSLLLMNRDEISKKWIDIALKLIMHKKMSSQNEHESTPSIEEINDLVAWGF